jgi:hypothetical protein
MLRQVFDEPRVRRDTHPSASEPMANWFLESTRPQAVEGRRQVNGMYERFPDAKGRLFAELHASDNTRLLSALDELLVHDLLARHYDVAYEQGENTQPDFRLYREKTYVGAVEVMTLLTRDDWAAEQRRHGIVTDALNKRLALTTHSIEFEILRWDANPSFRYLARKLQQTLDDLRADPAALPLDDFGMPEKVLSTEGSEILFRFLALPGDYIVQAGDQVIIGGAPVGGCVDSAIRLRERLDAKATKYDLYGKPYAIAVGVRDTMCDLREVHEALTGTSAVVIATGEGVRKGDGFFGNGRTRTEGKHRRVSAVCSIHEWFPGGPYRPRITRFDNPFAAAAFPDDALPFGGHWGVVERDPQRLRAGWLAPAKTLIPA